MNNILNSFNIILPITGTVLLCLLFYKLIKNQMDAEEYSKNQFTTKLKNAEDQNEIEEKIKEINDYVEKNGIHSIVIDFSTELRKLAKLSPSEQDLDSINLDSLTFIPITDNSKYNEIIEFQFKEHSFRLCSKYQDVYNTITVFENNKANYSADIYNFNYSDKPLRELKGFNNTNWWKTIKSLTPYITTLKRKLEEESRKIKEEQDIQKLKSNFNLS